MHKHHQDFLDALHALKRVELKFYSKEDGEVLTRTCAPMDYGPSRRAKDKSNRYHFWDYDSDSGTRHTLSLLPDQIVSIEKLDADFAPASFVTWNLVTSPWFVTRDWGAFS